MAPLLVSDAGLFGTGYAGTTARSQLEFSP